MARVVSISSIDTPSNFVGVESETDGFLPAGTYYYKIMAVVGGDGTSGYQSAPSAEIAVTTITNDASVDLSWEAVAGAQGYIVWRTIESGDYRHVAELDNNHYKCKTLRVNQWLLTTTSGTVYNDAAPTTNNRHVAETNQGAGFFRYLEFAMPQINIEGGDAAEPFSMEYMYQLDLANGWGYISRTGTIQFGYTYEVHAHFMYSAAFYWSETLYYSTWLLYGGLGVASSDSYFSIGTETEDESKDYTTEIISISEDGCSYAPPLLLFSGTTKIIGCTIRCVSRSYAGEYYHAEIVETGGGNAQIFVRGDYLIKRSLISGGFYEVRIYGDGFFLIEDSIFQAGKRPLYFGGGDYTTGEFIGTKIFATDAGLTLIAFMPSYVSFTDAYINALISLTYAAAYLLLIDSVFNESDIRFSDNSQTGGWGVGTGASVTNQHQCSLRVMDEYNQPIVGASATFINGLGELIADVETGIDGRVEDCIISEWVYVSNDAVAHYATPEEKTDYNPFLLTIKKAGYKTYTVRLTLTRKIDWEIALANNKSSSMSKRVKNNE